MSLSLISVNIEWDKHLETVLPFLAEQQPDILCVQEAFETTLPKLGEVTGLSNYRFAPLTLINGVPWGIAIFSRYPIRASREHYYYGSRESVIEYQKDNEEKTKCYPVIAVDIDVPDASYRILTVHFMWTPDGEADDFQRQGLANLLPLLEQEQDFVLCGDFNAPRGGEIYQELAKRYKDNIPPEYKTSIDVTLHRNGKTHAEHLSTKMVDQLFTTPNYETSDVALVSGVSDHMAVVATIQKS